MDKQRMPGRKFGSSCWKQARGTQVSSFTEDEPFLSEIMEKVQDISQGQGKEEGFISRADTQKLAADLPWSTEELELVFDGLDVDGKGYVATEEFTDALRCFLNSEPVTRQHRRRKTVLIRTPTNLSLEETNTEEQKCFESFTNQQGADKIFEERVADHNKKVQQFYEEMEQQIEREEGWLHSESKTQSQFHSVEMKKLLDVREREIRHFLTVQKELEMQLISLREKQHMTTTQTQELKQANVALENQLQQTLHHLQKPRRQLDVMMGRLSQMHKEERAPDDMASMTKADSESRTRVISIEEDPWADSVVEAEQYFPQEALGQTSLLRELHDAIAALSKVSESYEQPIDYFGFQGQMPLDQIRQNGNSQQNIMQEKIPPYDAVSGNSDPWKKISETLTGQATSQGDILLKEGLTHVQVSLLEMKQANISEPRMEVKTPEPKQGGSLLVPEVPSPVYKEVASPASKEGSIQGDSLILKQVIQPELHKQVLKCSDISQTQWPSADSEQRVLKQSSERKRSERKFPGSRHPPVKVMLSAPSPPSIALKLDVGCEPEISLLQNSQLENMSELEMQAQTSEGTEMPLSEDKREEWIDMPGGKKSQEVRPEMDEEREDMGTKETSKGTAAVCLHPDHVYNVLFVGNSNVGKTSFLYRLQDDSFGANMTATVGMDYRIKNLFVDNKCFALRLWDTAGQERYHSITKQFFRKADGVVLMYDITSERSFADVRYWLNCIQEGAGNEVIILLLGNKTDCIGERRVSVVDGAYLAKLLFCFFELNPVVLKMIRM
ncbi:ras-related protein Rab-44 isoform X2 [Rhineura floridana]|uniref:ras-related protein Rab-44 isoform X2 n=1 Tax=Rhineura floridana TaxID=261503 RepID=UPI002AC82A3B|nr:ras-related protein Rab-44 isoform X2 [Rhineura floridana]